ncbi:hypothetical protein D1007_07424 [Hordeum vulgare]|nr:hypothetical protein D1007_07424 [Hordeum vulgare]
MSFSDLSNDNLFDSSSGSSASSAPDPAYNRDVPIEYRMPITLSHTEADFYAWTSYFNLLFREYNLRDHIDNISNFLTISRDTDWMAIDATIIRWIFLIVSKDTFHTIVRDGEDASTMWNKIVGLFTDNKLQRIVFLQQEFFCSHQNASSIDAYCMRLNILSDELNDIDFKIGDGVLLFTLTTGLNEDLGNTTPNVTLIGNPTYERVVDYLRLEERCLKHLHSHAIDTTFVASFSRDGPVPSTAGSHEGLSRPDVKSSLGLSRPDVKSSMGLNRLDVKSSLALSRPKNAPGDES